MRRRIVTPNFFTDDQIMDACIAGMEAAHEYEGTNKSARTRCGNDAAATILGCKGSEVQAIFTAHEAFDRATR